MPSGRYLRRISLDDALLRAAYTRRIASHKDYSRWLYDHGIDPEIGKLNGAGRDFCTHLVENDDLRRRAV